MITKVAMCCCVMALFVTGVQASVVRVEQSGEGWQLTVDGKPFFIKGFIYLPVAIGQDPGNATLQDWMLVDDNRNGKNDFAYETWLDRNRNNARDDGEDVVGDFELMSRMGANTIRLYHVASDAPGLGSVYETNASTALQFDHAPNKELLRELHRDYGIRVIVGHFLGAWTIGAGASWETGTDYTNPEHIENIVQSVAAMVEDHKDEDYVLMWMLGNENNIADWSRVNASAEPDAYAKLVGRLAAMIKDVDPDHPVAVCDGDKFNTLPFYAEHAPDVDIMAYNSYRQPGFGNLWSDVQAVFDRPVLISEFGKPAYGKRGEELQFDYFRTAWQDIVGNRRGAGGAGNAIGGIVYDWVDRWYMDGQPTVQNGSGEEYFGVMSMGNGSDTYLRQERKAGRYLGQVWNP